MGDTEGNTDGNKQGALGRDTFFSKKIDSLSTFLTDIWKPKVKVKRKSNEESRDTGGNENDNIKALNETQEEFDNGFNTNDILDEPDQDEISPDYDHKFHRNFSWMGPPQRPLLAFLQIHISGTSTFGVDEVRSQQTSMNDKGSVERCLRSPPKPPRAGNSFLLIFPSAGVNFPDQDRHLDETEKLDPSISPKQENSDCETAPQHCIELPKEDLLSDDTEQLHEDFTNKIEATGEQGDSSEDKTCSTISIDDPSEDKPMGKSDSKKHTELEVLEKFDTDDMTDFKDFEDEEFLDDMYPEEEELFDSLDDHSLPCTCASDEGKEGATHYCISCPRHAQSRVAQFNKNLQMLQELARTEGLEIHDVVPDGNCMFRAIIDQLRMNGELEWTVNQIRLKAVNYLRENPLENDGTHFEAFLTQDGETWPEYLYRMSKDGEWGDQMILRGLVEVTRKEICIISTIGKLHNQTSIVPIKEEKDGKIYLGHVNDQHYYSLRPKGWQSRWYKEARKKKLALESTDSRSSSVTDIRSRTPGGVCFPMKDSQLINCGREYIDGYSNVPVFHLTFIMKNVLKPAFLFTPKRFFSGMSVLPPSKLEPFTLVGSVEEDLAVNIYRGIDQTLNNTKQPSQNAKKTTIMQNLYQIVDSTQVFFPRDRYELNKDVVVIHSLKTQPGYAKLEIQKDSFEMNKVNVGGKYFIDSKYYLHKCYQDSTAFSKPPFRRPKFPFQKAMILIYCYRCPQWPEETLSWFRRERPSGWPNEIMIRDIEAVPCVLSPFSHPLSRNPNIEWRFDFSCAEKFLLKDKITEQQRFCFHVFKLLIDFYTGRKCELSTFILKTVFLYSLEFIPLQQWGKCQSACLLYMLENLHECLKVRKIPHYFIPENNIISHISGEALYVLIERVAIIREFPIMSIVIMAESHNLMSTAVTDQVIEDLKHWSIESNSFDSILTTFVPAYSKQTNAYLSGQRFREAADAAVMGFEMLQEYIKSCNDSTNPYKGYTLIRFIDEATHSMHLYQTWWLCFFVDLFHKKKTLSAFQTSILASSRSFKRVGDFFTDSPPGLLDDVPVPDLAIKAVSHTSELYFEGSGEVNFFITMCSFLYMEKQFELTAHYIRTAVKQLNTVLNNQEALVADTERTQRGVGGNTDYVLQTYLTTISHKLFHLLCYLFHSYCYLGHPEYFQEYVEQLESLCYTLSTPNAYSNLARVWKTLGNRPKMMEALEKQKSTSF